MGSLCRKFVVSPYFYYNYNYNNNNNNKNNNYNYYTYQTQLLLPPPSSLIKTTRNHQVTGTATPFNPTIINNRNRFRLNSVTDDTLMSVSAAYQLLDVTPDCTVSHLKAAFRSKVKQFHPDVRKSNDDDDDSSDSMIRRVIQAYEVLSKLSKLEIIETECLDPFDAPECEAFDIFVNEVLCVGKGCPYSCVKTAPHAFTFSSSTGTAHATSQGHGEDYQVQLAVGQCPRSCIHYVTPFQRVILEELLGSILNMPFDCSAEAELLYSLVVKSKFENNRYRKPKKQPKASTKHVDLY